MTTRKRSVISRILPLILERLDKGQKRKVIVISLALLVNVVVDLIGLSSIVPVLYLIGQPQLIEKNKYIAALYNYIGLEDFWDFMLVLILGVFVIFLLKNLIGFLLNYLQVKLSNQIAGDITDRQLRTYMQRDYAFFSTTNSNFIMRDVATIPAEFSSHIIAPFVTLVTETLVVLAISISIAIYDPKLFIALTGVLLPTFIILYSISRKRITRLGEEKNQIRPRSFKAIFEAIHGYRDVKMFGAQEHFIQRSHRKIIDFYRLQTKMSVYETMPLRLIEVFAILGVVFIFVYYLKISFTYRAWIAQTLAVFATASYRVMPSLNRIINAMIRIKGSQYVFDIIEPLSTTSDDQPSKPVAFAKSIKLESVGFEYESGKSILRGVDLAIKKGSTIGIIGESGCGKTTLLKVIARFLKETNGRFLVDDVRIGAEEEQAWIARVGYVQQDYYMLDANLAENIAFGFSPDEIDETRLFEAIRMANLENFVSTLPKGIHTTVGEFGGQISGGQKQRIAIARALYKRAEVLLFDEATSALDEDTEAEVLQTIRGLREQGFTIVIVSHKKSILHVCNHIFEMKDGRLIKEIRFDDIKTDSYS